MNHIHNYILYMTLNLFGEDRDIIDLKNINHDVIENIAKTLLNKYVLVVQNKQYRMAEIEFYIKSENHNDQYTHGDKNQKKFAKFYFHRYPNGSYKGGTYKGVDLTYGDDDTCFGILIRSIYDLETNELIEGPCKTVNKILELYNCDDVPEFMENKKDPLNARSTKNFHVKRKNIPVQQIYKGSRIGLSDKYPQWKNVKYRYLTHKNMIKKGKADLEDVN